MATAARRSLYAIAVAAVACALSSDAAAQNAPNDAGVADAGAAADATEPGADAGAGALADPTLVPGLGPTGTPTEYSDTEARALELQRQAAELERLEAERERLLALEKQRAARSAAELLLSRARAELMAVRGAQADFERKLTLAAAGLESDRVRLAALAKRLRAAVENGGEAARRGYDRLAPTLASLRVSGLDAEKKLFGRADSPPLPDEIDSEIEALASTDPDTVRDLVELRTQLLVRAASLADQSEAFGRLRADFLHDRAAEFTLLEAELLRASTPEHRAHLRTIGPDTGMELRGEAWQVALDLLHWARVRTAQARELPSHLVRATDVGHGLWLLLKLLLLALVLRLCLRNLDLWIQAGIELVGHTISYGGGSLWVVRLLEGARHFGASLVVLLFTIGTYRLLAPASPPPEVEVAYILALYMSALRLQLRVVESIAKRIGLWSHERELERAALAEVDADGIDPDSATTPVSLSGPNKAVDQPPLLPAWQLFSTTWRRLTRYVAIILILLALTDFAVGKGVFHALVIKWAWLGAIPLTLFFLRTWRRRIVRAFLSRSESGGFMTRLAQKHSSRFYGLAVVFVAFLFVVARKTVSFVRNHLSNLDSTKRVLAFLFRRRVEKHAQQTGRVLEKPYDLPPEILAQFPWDSLRADTSAMKQPFVDDVLDAIENWREQRVDGSAAIVGAAGMGKTTALNLVEDELLAKAGDKMLRARMTQKFTRRARIVRWLATELSVDLAGSTDDATAEEKLIESLLAGEPRVVAIDDCHNLFLRKVGGFEAWRAFARIVNATNDKVFWLLTFNGPAWEYLSNLTGRVSYFRKTIVLPPWTENQLRKLILRRMRRTGYKTNFTDLLVTKLEGVTVSSQIIRTSQGYFRLLWDFTDGNPRLAARFWLRSLVPNPETKVARVHLFAAPRISDLDALSDDIAFVLTAVVEHENVSASEIATITNLPRNLVDFSVELCCDRGFLWRDPKSGRVSVGFVWQQTINTFLKRKHLLYTRS